MRVPALLVVVLLALPAPAGARVGTLDPAFSRDGHVSFSFGADEVVPVASVGDGAGGTYLLAQTAGSWVAARVTRHGVLRGGFGRGGRVVLRGADWDGNQRPAALALQTLPGGARRLLAAGQITGDVLAFHALSAATGAPDPGFGTGGRSLVRTGGYVGPGTTMAPTPDGAVTYGYSLYPASYLNDPGPALDAVRVLPSGSPDPAFGANGVTTVAVERPRGPVRTDLDAAGVVRVTAMRSLPGTTDDTTLLVTQQRLGRDGSVLAPGATTLARTDFSGALTAPAPGATMIARRVRDGTRVLRVGDDGAVRSTTIGGSRVGSPLSIVADLRGRTYVLTRRLTGRGSASIVRLTSAGRVDRRFGRRGVLALPMDRRHRLLDGVLTLDAPAHRLWVTGDDGDGLSDVRDDFAADRVYVASIRLR